MTPGDLIKQLCKDYEMTLHELADNLGKDPKNFARDIRNIRLSEFIEIIEEIGAEINVDDYTLKPPVINRLYFRNENTDFEK